MNNINNENKLNDSVHELRLIDRIKMNRHVKFIPFIAIVMIVCGFIIHNSSNKTLSNDIKDDEVNISEITQTTTNAIIIHNSENTNPVTTLTSTYFNESILMTTITQSSSINAVYDTTPTTTTTTTHQHPVSEYIVAISDTNYVDNSEYIVYNEDESNVSINNDDYIYNDITINEFTSLNYITEYERVMLCNVVGGEYGSDWVSIYDKACIVACVMNRYYDGGWQGLNQENTIYNIITAPGQFEISYANAYYNSNVTESCINAVEYYFENQSLFPHYTSFYGDGINNYFS